MLRPTCPWMDRESGGTDWSSTSFPNGGSTTCSSASACTYVMANRDSAITATFTAAAVNQAPVNTVPGPQSTNEDTALVFSSANGNLISVSDADAGGGAVKVTLGSTNGTLTWRSFATPTGHPGRHTDGVIAARSAADTMRTLARNGGTSRAASAAGGEAASPARTTHAIRAIRTAGRMRGPDM